MRLLLSGGSHRATLGAIGAIGYFCWSEATESEATEAAGSGRVDRWSDIDEVVSVSGGSLLNAALATASAESVADTTKQLAEVRRRLATDGLLPHRTLKRIAITAIAAAVLLGALGLMLTALGVTGPDALGDAPWPFVIGLSIFPFVLGLMRRIVAAYQRDVIDVITDGRTTTIESIHTERRRHIICSSGLASGLPYYFTIGGSEPFEPAYGTALTEGFTTAEAAAASTALPGLGRIRAPKRFRREMLVDGGVSGGFGEQVTTTIRRRPEDTWRSDGTWFAVDAVRHMTSNSRASRFIQSLSMISLLGRWLKVSLEATYVNDLVDLGPGQYARVWSPNIVPPAPAPPTAVFRDGSPADPEPEPEALPTGDARRRLGALQDQVEEMGLFALTADTVDLGIVVGFLSTLEVRRELSEPLIDDGLAWLDDQLDADGRLIDIWSRSAE